MCHNKFVEEVQSATRYTFLIIFFVFEHLSSAIKKDTKSNMWHLCSYLRKPDLSLTLPHVIVDYKSIFQMYLENIKISNFHYYFWI